ncbi:autotransporter outer membrane beta-barrel domain-containing protein [Jiella pacifica]|uniref:Autotransporter domain-containing protein n=1 Tax=Jiella pacifica TaxID=2696469 RepID=A0A6N9TAD8_9HYPH|nr:autotransporter outer membrane beta-barrel domain-containing protein [Jiella pacifica]NDW07175.1 autotransporter domain-containing protein [Jiella pacifica]
MSGATICTADEKATRAGRAANCGTVEAGTLTNPDLSYVILTAGGGVSGTFDGLTADEDFVFLDPALTYAATSVTLGLDRNGTSFASLAETDNGRNVAEALDKAASGDLFDALLRQTTAADAARAFELASGEVYGGVGSALITSGLLSDDLVLAHLRALDARASAARGVAPLAYDETADAGGRFSSFGAPVAGESRGNLGAWAAGYGDWTRFSGDGLADVDSATGGFLAGLDGEIGGWAVGIAGGYAHTDIDADDLLSSADADSYQVTLYGGRSFGALNVGLGGAYAYHDIEASRSVVFPGFSDSLAADIDADSLRLFGEVSYDMMLGGIAAQPFAGLSWTHLSVDDFTETGGAAALSSDGYDQDLGASTLGVRLATSFEANGMTVSPRATLGWRHAFGDTQPDVALSFVDTGADFSVSGAPIAKDAAIVEAGVDVEVAPNATLGISYRGNFGDDANSNGATGRFAVKF